MPIHPRDFIAEYVDPAVELFRKNATTTHLAVHAISEMDNLAEVVALWTLLGSRTMLEFGEATQFRKDLRKREPILGIMHDAHDSHKHGRLVRADKAPDPKGASQGQRPESKTEVAYFPGHSYWGGPMTPFQVLVVRLNDGSEERVYGLLHKAQEAWKRELGRLGL